jgi:hypothetical protein
MQLAIKTRNGISMAFRPLGKNTDTPWLKIFKRIFVRPVTAAETYSREREKE